MEGGMKGWREGWRDKKMIHTIHTYIRYIQCIHTLLISKRNSQDTLVFYFFSAFTLTSLP